MIQKADIEIVIPTHNRLPYLQLALESVLAQNYSNFTVTVVDSASSDGTLEFLQSVRCDRLRVVRFEDNLGISGNWTRALQTAEARLISIFHDDDIMLPDFVSRQVQMFSLHPDVVLSHTAGEVISERNEVLFFRKHNWPLVTDGKIFVERVLTEDALVPIPPSVVLNRTFLPETYGFDVNFPAMVDLVAWIQAARYGKIGYISEPLVQYRIHASQTTNLILTSYPKKMRQRELFFDLMRSELIENCRYTEIQAKKAAWKYFSRAVSNDLLRISFYAGNFSSKVKIILYFGARRPKLFLSAWFVGAAILSLTAPKSVIEVAKIIKNRHRMKCP